MNTEIEDQVRLALSERAGQITPDRLQPAVPPTATPARRPRLRWWHPLLMAAAVLVTVFFVVRLPGDTPPLPDAPAGTVPSPMPSAPTLPTAEPEPSTTESRERPATGPASATSEAVTPAAPRPSDAPPTSRGPSTAGTPESTPQARP